MATPATPAPSPVTLAVLDPLSADVTALCGTITAVSNLLATPAGQKLLEAELELGNTIEGAATKLFGGLWNGLVGLFKGKK